MILDEEILKIIDDIRATGEEVSIFGAGHSDGSYGKLVIKAMEGLGIRISEILDSDPKKWGTKYYGYIIKNPAILKDKEDSHKVFIASNYILPIVDEIKKYKQNNIFASTEILMSVEYNQINIHLDKEEYDRRVFNHYSASKLLTDKDDNQLNIRTIDIIVTEKCTLKCKDCSNLMQYYQNPKHTNIELLLQNFDNLTHVVDNFNEVRVLGGEPFLNKDLSQVINHLIKIDKIDKIIIYTNATIVPNKKTLKILKHKRVLIEITNYGALSNKHQELINVFKENNISYIAHTPQVWTDSGKIHYFDRSIKENIELFKKCCVNDLLTLLNGRLYRCPFSANAMNLKAIPEDTNDFIDMNDLHNIKVRLKSFYENKNVLSACNFCNGRDYTTAEVMPAIQINKPIDIEVYYG